MNEGLVFHFVVFKFGGLNVWVELDRITQAIVGIMGVPSKTPTAPAPYTHVGK